jgi:hypothetical protein
VTDLDREVADVLGLLGLLLVFVMGYFSAVLPQADALVERPAPDVQADLRTLIGRLRGYRRLAMALVGLIGVVLALLAPLTVEVVADWIDRGGYETVRAGLVMIDLFLIVMMGAGIWLLVRLNGRIAELRRRV